MSTKDELIAKISAIQADKLNIFNAASSAISAKSVANNLRISLKLEADLAKINHVPISEDLTARIADAEADIAKYTQIYNDNQILMDNANAELKILNAEYAASPTNESAADAATTEKYTSSEIVGDTSTGDAGRGGVGGPTAAELMGAAGGRGGRGGPTAAELVGAGAIPSTPQSAQVNIKSVNGNTIQKDMRVKIRVPDNYLTSLTRGPNNELGNLKGIIFPYTPTINVKHNAEYASQSPLHSNFALYFYKNSSVSPIDISGQFTVQNEQEAAIYLATIHLLRSLTKMRSGGSTGDVDSGAPPPVCRLDAYGAFMLQNVPVAISKFSVDLPNNVDYFTIGKSSGISTYEKTSVPVVSTISITCIPMYSRAEMQKFSVTGWLGDKNSRKAGYL